MCGTSLSSQVILSLRVFNGLLDLGKIPTWQGSWCGEKSLEDACTELHGNIDKLGMYITTEKVWDVALNVFFIRQILTLLLLFFYINFLNKMMLLARLIMGMDNSTSIQPIIWSPLMNKILWHVASFGSSISVTNYKIFLLLCLHFKLLTSLCVIIVLVLYEIWRLRILIICLLVVHIVLGYWRIFLIFRYLMSMIFIVLIGLLKNSKIKVMDNVGCPWNVRFIGFFMVLLD